MTSNDIVVMGHIATAFGVRGQLKVIVGTESPDSLLNFKTVYLKAQDDVASWQAYKIESLIVKQQNTVVIKFVGIDDRDRAMSLKGYLIGANRSQFPKLGLDEYYWVDLIGLEVVNTSHQYLGKVKSLIETGANDVLEIVDDEGKVRLIPFISQSILKVEMEQKRILVDWGMDY